MVVCPVPVMKLLLLRHAIAVPSGTPDVADDDRTLTARGRKRFRKAAQGLARIVGTPDAVLSSPLPRALETAEIAALAWGEVEVTHEALLAGGRPEELLSSLGRLEEDAVVALVGHEPDISRLLAHLIGASGERLPFKKGGAALVAMDNPSPGSGRLIWFLPPRLLRKLGGD